MCGCVFVVGVCDCSCVCVWLSVRAPCVCGRPCGRLSVCARPRVRVSVRVRVFAWLNVRLVGCVVVGRCVGVCGRSVGRSCVRVYVC